jgi:hypothetical protein
VDGHFAERHFAERLFADGRTFCRWTDILPKDILPMDGHFAERTFCQTDSLTNGQLAEIRDIF